MNTVTLPPEIVSLIAESVQDDAEGTNSLRSLAVVSSQFTESCQQALFVHLRLGRPLDFPRPLVGYEAAARHLEQFPHLAKYIKALTLSSLSQLSSSEDATTAILAILPRLKNIKSVKLQWGHWDQLAADVQEAIQDTINRAAARENSHFWLWYVWDVPGSLLLPAICSCRSLKLYFMSLDCRDDDNAAARTTPRLADRQTCLESLLVLASPRIYLLLREVYQKDQWTQLRFLSLRENPEDISPALDFLRLVAPFLEHLNLEYYGEITEHNRMNYLPNNLGRLRELHVAFDTIDPFQRTDAALFIDVLLNLLGNLKSPGLCSVTLSLWVSPSHRPSGFESGPTCHFPASTAASLDHVLDRFLASGAQVEVKAGHGLFYPTDNDEQLELDRATHAEVFNAALYSAFPNAMSSDLRITEFEEHSVYNQ
uniref:F-box domain-containing protein n=1 Tax=Mycena chlorophos TaxID=658473 RepID=A0ABQ0LLG2_MYCCL|nr:predicted protein [Mycena chlorophos]